MADTNYPGALDSFTDPPPTETTDGTTRAPAASHDAQHSRVNDALEAIETLLGITGAFNVLFVTGGQTLTVPKGAPGLTIHFETGSHASAIEVFDSLGNAIGGIGNTGGLKINGDRVQVDPDFAHFMALDGTTNPPSILGPSPTYGAGGRLYIWPGTPASGWVAGTTHVNDLWYDWSTGVMYVCTISGGGTAAGAWAPWPNTGATATALRTTFINGTASQLAQTANDAMVYLTIGTAGTAFSIAIGPTPDVANTIVAGATATSGTMYTVRLPAGWYLKWNAAAATLASQVAVTC